MFVATFRRLSSWAENWSEVSLDFEYYDKSSGYSRLLMQAFGRVYRDRQSISGFRHLAQPFPICTSRVHRCGKVESIWSVGVIHEPLGRYEKRGIEETIVADNVSFGPATVDDPMKCCTFC